MAKVIQEVQMIFPVMDLVNQRASWFLQLLSFLLIDLYTILEYLSYPQCYWRAVKDINPNKSWFLLTKILLFDTLFRAIIKITIYRIFIMREKLSQCQCHRCVTFDMNVIFLSLHMEKLGYKMVMSLSQITQFIQSRDQIWT